MARSNNGFISNYLETQAVGHLEISDEVSVSVWWKRASGTTAGLFEKTIGGSVNTSYLLFVEGSNVKFRCAVPSLQTAAGSTNISDTDWHHVCGTYDGANVKVFLDGSQDGSVSTSGSITTGSGVSRIALLGSNIYPMNGTIAQVAVWDKSLSSTEILSLSVGACPLRVRSSGLVGYWPCFGSAAEEPDLSGHGASASLNGTMPTREDPPKGRMGRYEKQVSRYLSVASSNNGAGMYHHMRNLGVYA